MSKTLVQTLGYAYAGSGFLEMLRLADSADQFVAVCETYGFSRSIAESAWNLACSAADERPEVGYKWHIETARNILNQLVR